MTLRLATRGSKLALAQSSQVACDLTAATGLAVGLHVVRTTGDRVTDRPLHDIGGKGLFTKEVELALLAGEADLAVHSMKDVPVTMPLVPTDGLTIAAVPRRAAAHDVVVGEWPPRSGLRVGTGSLRRRALLLDVHPEVEVVPVRGNVDTRVGFVTSGELDAVVLAAAGLDRLGEELPLPVTPLDLVAFPPAAGQGALAVQCRADDAACVEAVATLDDADARAAVGLERRVVELLDGDCTSPIAAHATRTQDGWAMSVAIGSDGGELPVKRASVDATDVEELNARLSGVMSRLA